MSKWKIAWRSIQRRSLASTLTTLSMALGVMLVVAVVAIHGLVEESFRNNSSLGYNVIVGATKGGRLQIVLNTVYYLSQPVENIPYSYYQEFLSAEEIKAYRDQVGSDQLGDPRDGKFRLFTKFAIPLCLGDYYGHFRVVGTTPQLFEDFIYDLVEEKKYEFMQGRNFKTFSEENGYFECIVGSKVAREKRLTIGTKISATHGDPEGELHDEHPFTVVGILKPSGTPNDRAVFVNIEGFYLMDGHAKPIQEAEGEISPTQQAERNSKISLASHTPFAANDPANGGPGNANDDKPGKRFRPISVPEREVTAVLIKTVNQVVTPGLVNTINEDSVAQAALPVAEIFGLFNIIVKPIQQILLILTVMICIVSGVSILVSIYNSMSDRRHEIAVMRALGAGRGTVMSVVLFESIILSLGGGFLGWVTAHGAIAINSARIESQTGVSVGFWDFPAIRVDDYLNVQWMIRGTNSILETWGFEPIQSIMLPTELWLVPGLVLLAVFVGLLPALSAYRTDVAKALSSTA